jgi:hypothetical protein
MGRGRSGGRSARPCRNGSYGCNGNRCLRCGDEQRAARREESTQPSRWTPAGSRNPDVGVIEGTDHVVSFKTGGRTGDQTLIRDGDYSTGEDARDEFDDEHDHYGSKAEGGWIDEIRGFFSG